jgi:DNA-binding transcriptional MerR regulator
VTAASTNDRRRAERSDLNLGSADVAKKSYTIDQLAAVAGVPSRTVRLYQSEGLLPPPARKGRIGLYDDSHLERLEVVAQLQDRGLQLRAIRDALREVAKGKMSLEEWLGMEADLRAPWREETALTVTEEELHIRLGQRSPGFVAALVRADLLQRQVDHSPPGYVIPSPGLLDIALRLEAAGVDIDTGAQARELIRKRIRRAAEDVVRYFSNHVGEGFTRSGSPQEIADALQALRVVGPEVVRLLFTQEIETAIRSAVEAGAIHPRRRRRK